MMDRERLERSPVVANNAMNRERGLDSYVAELRFDIAGHLGTTGSWLDLCCGQGRALLDMARRSSGLELEGLDLVDHFLPGGDGVIRRVGSVEDYRPRRRFNLITCVHGLHYVGDKLGVIERAMSWLEAGGVFLAHLDLKNVRLGERPARAAQLFTPGAGLHYHPRFRLLRGGPGKVRFGWRYLGADDTAGANWTGQAAVNSHYTI